MQGVAHQDPADPPTPARRRTSLPWAQLLRRVFFLDALKCPRCATPMVVLAIISDPPVVTRILRHLRLPTELPPFAPARASTTAQIRGLAAPQPQDSRRWPPRPAGHANHLGTAAPGGQGGAVPGGREKGGIQAGRTPAQGSGEPMPAHRWSDGPHQPHPRHAGPRPCWGYGRRRWFDFLIPELADVLMSRYEKASTIISSNRVIEDWAKLLGDVVVVTPLLDRVMHHGHLLKFEGKSWRLREAAARVAKRSTQT